MGGDMQPLYDHFMAVSRERKAQSWIINTALQLPFSTASSFKGHSHSLNPNRIYGLRNPGVVIWRNQPLSGRIEEVDGMKDKWRITRKNTSCIT